MTRKFFRRFLPDPHALRDHPNLRMFRHWLHQSDLWHLNRRSASTGLAIGMFMAFMPMPLQMIPAVALAILLRANILLAIAGVWLTNPFTMGPLFLMCYKIGAWVLNTPVYDVKLELSWAWLRGTFIHIWQPFLFGSFLVATIASALSYVGVRMLWRWQVVRAWEKRKLSNSRKRQSRKN
jgi:uncharacterized protein (DUF2062 family)